MCSNFQFLFINGKITVLYQEYRTAIFVKLSVRYNFPSIFHSILLLEYLHKKYIFVKFNIFYISIEDVKVCRIVRCLPSV